MPFLTSCPQPWRSQPSSSSLPPEFIYLAQTVLIDCEFLDRLRLLFGWLLFLLDLGLFLLGLLLLFLLLALFLGGLGLACVQLLEQRIKFLLFLLFLGFLGLLHASFYFFYYLLLHCWFFLVLVVALGVGVLCECEGISDSIKMELLLL